MKEIIETSQIDETKKETIDKESKNKGTQLDGVPCDFQTWWSNVKY